MYLYSYQYNEVYYKELADKFMETGTPQFLQGKMANFRPNN